MIALRPVSLRSALEAVRDELPARSARQVVAPAPAASPALRAAQKPAATRAASRSATRAAASAPLAYVAHAVPGQNVAVSEIYAV